MSHKSKKDIDLIKETTLILTQTDPLSDMMFQAWIDDGLHADILFSPVVKIQRMVRRLWLNFFLPGYSLWFGAWKKKLTHYETVIIHASELTRTVPNYIHKMKPSMRIIYWYWNPVNAKSLPQLTKNSKIECWSFDKYDCAKYNMKQNIQYYYDQTQDDLHKAEILYDVYFVGHDKGRSEKLHEIHEYIDAIGLNVKIDLVDDSSPNVPYAEVQKRIRKCRAILEVLQDGQVGCTLRALEALFYRKKLITTNFNIVNEDFYNSDNIFIYGKDDLNRLPQFISGVYNLESDKYREQHTIDAWISNFY